MIQNMIFDIGNVLYRYQPKKYLKQKFQDEKRVDRLMKEIFQHPYWYELDAGHLTWAEAAVFLGERFPDDREAIEAVFADRSAILEKIPESFALVRKLREQGFQTYLLSNMSEAMWQDLLEKDQDMGELFDGQLISAQCRMLKPDQRIYQALLDQYHLKAEACLFFDDMEENIEAAKQVGLAGWVFTDANDVALALFIDSLRSF